AAGAGAATGRERADWVWPSRSAAAVNDPLLATSSNRRRAAVSKAFVSGMAGMQSSRWWNAARSLSLWDMITFLGQGRMGVPMARRLTEVGHQVTTWRRGAGVDASSAVEGADLVITVLRDPDAVREVLTAALPGLRPGATVVEMSTIGPQAVWELRTLLPPEVRLVDAPVLGSVGPAAAGTLTVLAGGDVSGCREVLEVFGTVRECGPLGSGAALKLAVMSALVPA